MSNTDYFYGLGTVTDGHSYNQNNIKTMRMVAPRELDTASISASASHSPAQYGMNFSEEEIAIKLHPDTILFFEGFTQEIAYGFTRKLTFKCTDKCLVKQYFTNDTQAKQYLSIFDPKIPTNLFYSQFTKQINTNNTSNSDEIIYSELDTKNNIINEINYQISENMCTESSLKYENNKDDKTGYLQWYAAGS